MANKRNKRVDMTVAGKPTGITLEREFWGYLEEIAIARDTSRGKLVTDILAADPTSINRCSTLRTFCLAHAKQRAEGWHLDERLAKP